MCDNAARRQGVFPPSSYAMLGLPGNWYGALEWQYPPHMRQGSYEEEGRAVNTLKARPRPCVLPAAPANAACNVWDTVSAVVHQPCLRKASSV